MANIIELVVSDLRKLLRYAQPIEFIDFKNF